MTSNMKKSKSKQRKQVNLDVIVGVLCVLLVLLFIVLCIGWLYSTPTEAAEEVMEEVAETTEEVMEEVAELSEREKLLLFVEDTALEYGLTPSLVKAVIQTESDFRVEAVNYNGTCFGLMQINKVSTSDWIAKQLGKESYDLFDPYDNVEMGCYYLAYLRDLWLDAGYTDEDTFALTLLSYNRGVRGCKRWITKNDDWYANSYVSEVLMHKSEFENEE